MCVYVVWFGFLVFSATFNNISVISWQLVLLVEETDLPQVSDKLDLYFILKNLYKKSLIEKKIYI